MSARAGVDRATAVRAVVRWELPRRCVSGVLGGAGETVVLEWVVETGRAEAFLGDSAGLERVSLGVWDGVERVGDERLGLEHVRVDDKLVATLRDGSPVYARTALLDELGVPGGLAEINSS